jgi:multidrug efflux pump subunit AcrA (membrane-fusion protein)
VGDIPVREGDTVTPATLLTTVDEPGALEAYIYVPVEKSKALKLGLPVQLKDANDRILADTRITFVSPQVDTGTQTILAKAIVPPQAGLRVAEQARATVTWSVHEGTVIPILAVSRINGQFFAFITSKEGNGLVARQKVVNVGETVGNDFVVLGGIKAGDHIIVSQTQFLQDGAPVTEQIVQTSEAGGISGATNAR